MSPRVLDAASRQQDELIVIRAMYEDQVEVESSNAAFCVRAQEAGAWLHVMLPPQYPYEPLQFVLSCPTASTSAIASATRELNEIAQIGEECCAPLIQRFLQLASDELAALPVSLAACQRQESNANASASQSREGTALVEEIMLHIDHMNDHVAYMKLLQRWADNSGLSGLVVYCDTGRRVHDVIICLQGEVRAVTAYLHQLRTELVDVDSKGRKCRERQSTVLCRRPAGTHKAGCELAVKLSGWRCVRYLTGEERDALLDEVGFLHVGSGTERFATSA